VHLAETLTFRYGPGAEEKEIDLKVDVPKGIPEVLGDEKLIERAIGNIVQNAIYYTPRGGRVEFSLRLNLKFVEVVVKDTGIGIPEESLPHVFERFYRVDKDRSKRTGGSGLGLAITKRIVEAHQSELELTSVVGQGTKLLFHLAVADA
jgi:two-component system phosphate regulon sensor histidine kinase PhoR